MRRSWTLLFPSLCCALLLACTEAAETPSEAEPPATSAQEPEASPAAQRMVTYTETREPCDHYTETRVPLFGDLHVHTAP